MALIRSVILHSLQKECSALLNLVVLEEDLGHLLNVCLGLSLISVGDHLGKIDSGLGVDGHNLS